MLNTYAERLKVANHTDCFFHTVRRANTILDFISAEWLGNTEIHSLSREEMDTIVDFLDSVSIMLFDAMREFKLETGMNTNDPEIETFFKSVDQYKLNAEVNDLHSQIIDIALKMHGNAAAALWRRREATISMPDAEALPILKEILEEARGGQKNAV